MLPIDGGNWMGELYSMLIPFEWRSILMMGERRFEHGMDITVWQSRSHITG